MDFSPLGRIDAKMGLLFEHIKELKEENRQLKRKIYTLELNLNQAKASVSVDAGLKEKYANLVEERDRLVMERELMRKKVEGLIGKVDEALTAPAMGGDDEE